MTPTKFSFAILIDFLQGLILQMSKCLSAVTLLMVMTYYYFKCQRIYVVLFLYLHMAKLNTVQKT
jgi:hypothetical protein